MVLCILSSVNVVFSEEIQNSLKHLASTYSGLGESGQEWERIFDLSRKKKARCFRLGLLVMCKNGNYIRRQKTNSMGFFFFFFA